VRIEDLALVDPSPALAALARFLGLPDRPVPEAAALFRNRHGSYGGGKLSEAVRRARIIEFGATAREELRRFGYRHDEYGLATTCEDTELCGIMFST
jgi:hypothetical protein